MDSSEDVEVVFIATSPLDQREEFAASITEHGRKMTLVGSAPEIGGWELQKGITLTQAKSDEKEIIWQSAPIKIKKDRFPFKYRYVANAHRHSPTTNPLIWDRLSRISSMPPNDSNKHEIVDRLLFKEENSDSGWVTSYGVGAFQLRVGQPPGSKEPLVILDNGITPDMVTVQLYESKSCNPDNSIDKAFAVLSTLDLGFPKPSQLNFGGDKAALGDDNVTYLINGQSVSALGFRVDVNLKSDGSLLGRGFVSHESLMALQGSISIILVGEGLKQVGVFKSAYLVVTACDIESNKLTDLQRSRWTPEVGAYRGTLDIGHRGSGASNNPVAQRSVRENTLLSFQKAAVNHSDFIEFDVHVTSDSEVIVHHDFEIKLAVGKQKLSMGIPTLTYSQLSSNEFTNSMISDSVQSFFVDAHQRNNLRFMKRNNSSAEDMLRKFVDLSTGRNQANSEEGSNSWRISDRIASLREAFRSTPKWLGFNIELKYPDAAELKKMHYRFYDRNYFCDTILKVVLEEAGTRKIIFSTFDPDCATLLSLKQPRFPVFFLTCAGTKNFPDPRMNSVEAALFFAVSSNLQGVVVESTLLLDRLKDIVKVFHEHGLYLFTYGDVNNKWENYAAQKEFGLDGIILDDVAKFTKASGKQRSFFNPPFPLNETHSPDIKSPEKIVDVDNMPSRNSRDSVSLKPINELEAL